MESVEKLLATQGVEAFEFFGLGSVETEENVYVTPDQFQAYMDVTRSLSGPGEYEQFENFVDDYLGKLKLKNLFNKNKKPSPKKVARQENRAVRKETRHENKAERKETRQEKKAERKEDRQDNKGFQVAKKILQTVNKVNPITLAVRNALRGLIALNFLGMASAINAKSDLRKKVENMYLNMGGKIENLSNSVKTGVTKKALFNKDAEKYSGLGSFGSVTIAALLTSAGAFVLKIWNWMKEAGIKVVSKVKSAKTEGKPRMDGKPKLIDRIKDNRAEKQATGKPKLIDRIKDRRAAKDKPKIIDRIKDSKIVDKVKESGIIDRIRDRDSQNSQSHDSPVYNAQDNQNLPENTNKEDDKKKNNRKILLIGIGTLAVGGLGYWAYSSIQNKKEHKPNSKKLRADGLMPLGYVELS